MIIARYFSAASVAVVISFGLFFLMQSLISLGRFEVAVEDDRFFVDFVRIKKEQTIETKRQKPSKPPVPQALPPPAPQPQSSSAAPGRPSVAMTPVPMQADLAINTDLGFAAGDGDYLPILKVAPIYPRRAAARGIEGYVIVEFIVTKTGSVKDPVVVESEPPGVFDKAALNAVVKFKYKPKVVSGAALEVRGVRNKMTFKLED